ncbi:hypothetical protein TBLA_0A05750 [Henningerozyma blattae CBS 6284]|uniref:Uncharacterized protein n=1 Tax=Henningerozyma blattae (strain ATCC 34711 / CBS 6284 / DSM 70876 / NBRC 10599 / NRRL Y-10934 / UCD 77-7) TaxID=1071380 RepID=I2GW66_HENB6|nr:hypothetical protein TBLA_0A05750 [Tetrapisispora blattae CBS 6284]CCH58368.1 hypothetical protein TBLA_0A05750 [Tetrapisispora blattae CBS 6284]
MSDQKKRFMRQQNTSTVDSDLARDQESVNLVIDHTPSRVSSVSTEDSYTRAATELIGGTTVRHHHHHHHHHRHSNNNKHPHETVEDLNTITTNNTTYSNHTTPGIAHHHHHSVTSQPLKSKSMSAATTTSEDSASKQPSKLKTFLSPQRPVLNVRKSCYEDIAPDEISLQDVNTELEVLPPPQSHKIFTFSMPFGGTASTESRKKSTFPKFPTVAEKFSKVKSKHKESSPPEASGTRTNSIVSSTTSSGRSIESSSNVVNVESNISISTDATSSTMISTDEIITESKQEIKHKLIRQNSITSLEELALFDDEKGITNVRNAAFKKTFQLDTLKHSIKNIVEDPNAMSADGYRFDEVNHIFDELEGDVVILGGYRGSVLRDVKTHKRLWVPLEASLNLSNDVNLIIGPRDIDEIDIQSKIKPDGMLTHCGPVDISKRLIHKLSLNKKVHVEDFGYDWRLSLDLVAVQLAETLQKLYDKQTVKKGVYVVAHSMGGMITHKVLQDHTELIRGIVYVGCPNQCPNVLGPIRFGDEILLNKTILSKEANFFMRSSFSFLPMDGRLFVDKTGRNRFDLDFYDPNVWIEYGLSPLVSKRRKDFEDSLKGNPNKQNPSDPHNHHHPPHHLTTPKILKTLNPIPIIKSVNPISNSSDNHYVEAPIDENEFVTSYDDSVKYLKNVLIRTKNFHESLAYNPEKNYPPLVIVFGNKIPTVRGAKVCGLQDIKDGIYNDFYYGAGDGVVHEHWLLPEKIGFPVEARIATHVGHVSLMSDLTSMAKAFVSLRKAELQREKDRQSESNDVKVVTTV